MNCISLPGRGSNLLSRRWLQNQFLRDRGGGGGATEMKQICRFVTLQDSAKWKFYSNIIALGFFGPHFPGCGAVGLKKLMRPCENSRCQTKDTVSPSSLSRPAIPERKKNAILCSNNHFVTKQICRELNANVKQRMFGQNTGDTYVFTLTLRAFLPLSSSSVSSLCPERRAPGPGDVVPKRPPRCSLGGGGVRGLALRDLP